jgi:SAM-dependent methyltransferase
MRFSYYLGRRYNEHEFWLGIKTKSEQFRARNSIVEAAYQVNADYLLMMDDDHIIDIGSGNYASEKYEFLRTLIGHMEADKNLGLVGALYYHRGGQCRPVLLNKTPDGDYGFLTDDQIQGKLQEVDVQGGGCMLIRMRAMDFCGAPWFVPETEYGTDFQICIKMKKAGFKVACDTSIEIGHVASERKVITSRNRHQVQADATKVSKDLEISARLDPVYRQFRADVMEYLEVDNLSQLMELAAESEEHREKFEEYEDKDQYYRDAGRSYVARAAKLATLEAVWPNSSDDFVMRTLRHGVPAIGIDFGCGPGRVTFEMAKGGHLIHFIDIDGVSTYEFLKWRIKKYGVLAKFNEWPEPNTADYAIAHDIFEHITDLKTPLKKICRSLKSGGVLITNYLLMQDWQNIEHINNDKPGFLETLKSLGMVTVNSCVFQKIVVDQNMEEAAA